MRPDIAISVCGDMTIGRLGGEIDIAVAASVEETLLAAVAETPGGLVIDLSAVRYLDSGGVRMLFRVSEQLKVSRRRLALVVPHTSALRRLVKITGLAEAIPVAGSVEACLESFSPEPAGEP